MGRVSKRQMALDMYAQIENRLQCPLCRTPLAVEIQGRLRCTNNHSFDLAKNGTVQLTSGPLKAPPYDARLFRHRWEIMCSGFFDPLLTCLAATVKGDHDREAQPMILDAGCGAGTHLDRLRVLWHQNTNEGHQPVWMGIDISKDAIHTAATMHPGSLWITADLNALPLAPQSCDVILNVLSPSSYGEFARVLRPGGKVFKVIPGAGYLRELRSFIPTAEEYSNELVLRRFETFLENVERKPVHYRYPLTRETAYHLVAMTPLGWNQDPEALSSEVFQRFGEVTVDLLLLSGQPRA